MAARDCRHCRYCATTNRELSFLHVSYLRAAWRTRQIRERRYSFQAPHQRGSLASLFALESLCHYNQHSCRRIINSPIHLNAPLRGPTCRPFSSGRQVGGLGSSVPKVTCWPGDICTYFPTSVVYASILGAVLVSLSAINTRLGVFDTAVVDLRADLFLN